MSIFKRMYQIERDISEEYRDQVSRLIRENTKLEEQMEELKEQLEAEQIGKQELQDSVNNITNNILSYTKDLKLDIKG